VDLPSQVSSSIENGKAKLSFPKIRHCEIAYKGLICRIIRFAGKIAAVNRTSEEWKLIDEEQEKERKRKDKEWYEKFGRAKEVDDKCLELMNGVRDLMCDEKYEEVERILCEALEFKMKNLDCHFSSSNPELWLLDLYYETKNVDTGLDLLIRIQKEIPEHSVNYSNWRERWIEFGHNFERDGDIDIAERIYFESIKMNPDYGETYKRLSLIYERSGRYEEAEQICIEGITRGFNSYGFEGRLKRIRKKRIGAGVKS
jgi:tetratricopeptide (TPR) repeat protein